MHEARPIRIGVVSFLNALPFVDGLEHLAGIDLHHAVPSLLIDRVVGGAVDLALCSSIDYQRTDASLVVAPIGLLGCDGPTLTVRLFSTRPPGEIRRVHCDTDSHTSVTLMQILLRERYGLDPELVPYDARQRGTETAAGAEPEAILLIGDKVVTDSPAAARYSNQLDLGALWAEHTAYPFVFALWLARRDVEPGRLRTAAAVLDRQLRYNRMRIDALVHGQAARRRWPKDLAASYLKEHITYAFTERHLEALELFYEKAHAHGLIEHRREVELAGRAAPAGLGLEA